MCIYILLRDDENKPRLGQPCDVANSFDKDESWFNIANSFVHVSIVVGHAIYIQLIIIIINNINTQLL